MANVADTTYSLVRETIVGTTPATPAFQRLDITSAEFSINSEMLTSEVIRANRAAGDSAPASVSCTGKVTTDFRRDSTAEMLLEAALGGTFSSNVLKGGSLDIAHTVEQRMVSGSGTPLHFRYTGNHVGSFTLSVDPTAKATSSFDFVGLAQTYATPIITGATYPAITQGALLTGAGAGSVTIAGLTATYYSLDLQVSYQRSAKFGLFSQNAFGISTGGNRQVTLTMKVYRDDFSPETVFVPGQPISVSFALGSGANNVYTFALPRAFAKNPVREVNGNDELVTIELKAAHDATEATDIKVTRS